MTGVYCVSIGEHRQFSLALFFLNHNEKLRRAVQGTNQDKLTTVEGAAHSSASNGAGFCSPKTFLSFILSSVSAC